MFKKALLATALFALTHNSHAQFSQTVFFGDSLTDSGYYRPITSALYPISGTFTTNPDPMWSQVLAAHLGTQANPNGNGQTGTNYAIGGARVTTDTTNTDLGIPISVPSANSQIQNYLTHNTIDPNALYTVWIGANDLLNTSSSTEVIKAAQDTAGLVNDLRHAGATYVLVPNLPDIGLTPRATTAGISTAATAAANLYNNTLYQSLQQSGANVIPLDTFSLLQEVAKNPASFGFSNITDTACAGSSLVCAKNASTDGYLFADGIHPTGQAHQAIGDYAYSVLQAPQQIGHISQRLTAQHAGNNRLFQRLNSQDSSQSHVWATGTLQSHDSGLSKTDNSDHGVRVGADFSQGNYTLGAYLNYDAQSANWQNAGGSFDVDKMGLGVYHQGRFGKVRLNTGLGMDKLSIDTQRQVALGLATRQHSAKASGHHAYADVQVGYDMGKVLPYVGLNWQHVKIGQLVEDQHNLSTSMQFDKHTYRQAYAKAGVQVNYPISDMLMVGGALGLNHRLMDDEQNISGRLQSVSANHFSLPVHDNSKKTAAELSLFVNTKLKGLDLHAGLSGQFADSDNQNIAGQIGISKSF